MLGVQADSRHAGMCVSDRHRVWRHSRSWEEKLTENQLIPLPSGTRHKSLRESRRRGAPGWERQTAGEARWTRVQRGPACLPWGVNMEQRGDNPQLARTLGEGGGTRMEQEAPTFGLRGACVTQDDGWP